MSFRVTALVRAARLPKTMSYQRRPAAKGILLALADRCDDDGRNAWPSIATIATEVEIGARTAQRILRDLQQLGLIDEQAPPRQHRPRTWRLNPTALVALAGLRLTTKDCEEIDGATYDKEAEAALSDLHTVAGLPNLDTTQRAGLANPDTPQHAGLSEPSDGSDDGPGVTAETSGVTATLPGVTARTSRGDTACGRSGPDPVLLNDPLNKDSGASAARSLTLLKGYAWDVVAELGRDCEFSKLTARLKTISDAENIQADATTIAEATWYALNAHRFGRRAATP